MSNKAGGDATGQGLLFGRYRPVSVMMVANFATTTKGFDILTERPVIITTLKKTKLASARSRVSYTLQQMRSDAALATKRTHPSTLDIYDQVEDDENCHIISEFTEYSPITRMHAILTKDDVFSVMEAFEKIVNIMQYLNQSGVFGCCVREGNVFISPTGDVKIDNLFSSRMNFIADLPELGPHIAGMAVADGGAFLNRDANIRLDLKLIGGVLKSLLYLANKRRDANPAVPEKAEESQIANRAELGQIVMPKIDNMVQKLGMGTDDPAYASIAELAEDVRAVTADIRAAKSVEPKAALRSTAQRRRYMPGDTIFREGDPANDEAFIVEEGSVQVLKNAPDGREIYLDVTLAGDILGEMALIDGQPRMATAKAIEPCTVAIITGTEFKKMIGKVDPVPKRLIDVLVRRLRYQSGEIAKLKAVLGVNK